ncbi:MAG TPA: hypothetical protein VGG06_01240 [Thermoanaerobaculia bacterium]|jgi:hypothetical protein
MDQPRSSQSVSPVPYWEVVERALAPSRKAPAALPTVYVSDLLARQSARLLELAERDPSAPPVLYWLGFELGERACVTTLVRPDGAVDRSLLTSAVAWDETLAAVADASLVYLGEATSRPEEAPPASPELPFGWLAESLAGRLSVVIPPLREGAFELAKCTVYRHLDGGYRRLAAGELDAHLRVVPGYTDLRKYRPAPPPRPRAALVNVAEV